MKLSLNYKLLLENKQKILRVAIIALLILATLFLFLFRTGNQNDKEMIKQSETDSQTVQTEESTDVIVVDVSGEVKTPSVIELPPDSRINDAIRAAGGLTKNADITQINRAAVISDGEKIFIPTKQNEQSEDGSNLSETSGQNSTGMTGNTGEQGTGTGQININNASSTKLQEVPGIGPVTADKIIQYRTANGLFRKLEDIMKVSGIGDKTFAKMKPYICI